MHKRFSTQIDENMNKRTIKFRAFDKRLNEMIYFGGSPGISWEYNQMTIECASTEDQYKRVDWITSGGDCEWMQFTGLLDKNGKEIYEGDVVRLGSLLVGEVKFDEGEFALFCTVRGAPWRDSLITSIEYREIIGNIYENSDLLKNIIPQFIK